MDECFCCKVARGGCSGFQAEEYIVKLEGGWVLNHFNLKEGKKENYLGRLVLAVEKHRPSFGELSPKEATTLGVNLQRINCSIRQYWIENFDDDLVERIYVSYFDESPYIINPESRDKPLAESHVHLHLLTRTRKMGEALCNYCAELVAWHLVDNIHKFPPEYQVSNLDDEKVKKLMKYLKDSLSRPMAEVYQP